jgi:hypothetical protein
MSEPMVTWSNEHEEDYQKRLLAAYRLVYRAHNELSDTDVSCSLALQLRLLRERMSDRTRLLASQWERKQWHKEAKG